MAILGRVLAASRGGEELLGLVPGLVGGHAAMAGDGEPPAAAAGVAVLDQVGLATAGLEADAEAADLRVEDHEIAAGAGLEGVDGAFGELGHVVFR